MVPISAVAHANVNCAQPARSRRFYTALPGLRAAAHTAPERPRDWLWALFFPDPDGPCLELIQSPRVLGR